MSDQFTLTFTNDSAVAGSACLYQTAPTGLQSLAWLVRDVAANGTASFTWNMTYGFMFMDSASTGTGFAEIINADPVAANSVTLAVTSSGCTFGVPAQVSPAGTLTVVETVTDNTNTDLLAGFALDESPLFGAAVATGTLTYVTSPSPTYMLAFGAFSPGEVVDPSGPVTPVSFTFASGTTSMTATLSSSNVLTVTPSS